MLVECVAYLKKKVWFALVTVQVSYAGCQFRLQQSSCFITNVIEIDTVKKKMCVTYKWK